jgi:fumarylpyruvate hydrolase
MSAAQYLFTPPETISPVRGEAARYPVRRVFCVGRQLPRPRHRNGQPCDKACRCARSLHQGCLRLFIRRHRALPGRHRNYQHELELVVAIGAEGFPCRKPTPNA